MTHYSPSSNQNVKTDSILELRSRFYENYMQKVCMYVCIILRHLGNQT